MNLRPLLSLGVLLLVAPGAPAQLPQTRITSVFPPGAQQGTSVDVALGGGTDLDEVDQMVFSHPGITAAPKLDAAGNPVAGTFTVAVASDVPPGLHDVRVRGLFGVSNPRAFRIDSVPESAETEPNNSLEQATAIAVGSTINARANAGADVDVFRIPVVPGQTLVIRTEAARIDSPMQPHLQLSSSQGRRLAESRRVRSQEAVIVWTSSSADELQLRVQDVVYGGGDQFVYRITVDSRPVVDWVSPGFVIAGQPTPVTIFGRHLPGGKPTEHQINGQPVQRLQVLVPALSESSAAGSDAAAGFADSFVWNGVEGNLVRLGIGSQAPVSEAADAPEQFASVPFEATGSFGERSDEDVFRFDAHKSDVRMIEVFAQRIGSLADPLLIVERANIGGDGSLTWSRIGAEDDDKQNPGGADLPTLSDDPVFRLEVPEDGTYRVRLRDRYGERAGDARLQYRLSVREPRPDYRLVVFDAFPSPDGKAPSTSRALCLRKGGAAELAVYAYRRDGHNDAITVTADQLPAGLQTRPSVIGPGQNSARLIVTAAADAPEQLSPFRIIGQSGEGDAVITREARTATLVHDAINGLPRTARMSQSLIASVMKDDQPFSIHVDPLDVSLSQDQQLLIPVSITRRAGFEGKVDLSIYNVPGETDAPAAAIEAGATSTVARLYFQEKAPAITSTLLVQGTASVPYRRNPWQADRAKAKVTETEAAVVARQTETATVDAALKDAQLVVATLTEQSKKLADELAAHTVQQQALRDQVAKAVNDQSTAVATVVAAQQKLAALQTSAASTADEVAAALSAVSATSTEAAAATASLDTLSSMAAELTKQLLAVSEQATVTQQAKQQAETDATAKAKEAESAQAALAEAQKTVEAATASKAAADEALKKAEEASKPNNVNVRAVSEPVIVRLYPSPAKVSATVADGGSIKRGAAMAVKVAINRRNNYSGPMKLSLGVPPGLTGISAGVVDVPADQNEGTLTVTIAADAPLGALSNVVIQATADFNGRGAATDAPIALTIIE